MYWYVIINLECLVLSCMTSMAPLILPNIVMNLSTTHVVLSGWPW